MSADTQTSQAKFQKLAADYNKVRAQNAVLKKGVIDEQEKTRTLQETLKQKDQRIRKYEQEIDSLQFRNDQLSKRVGFLQDELDGADSKGRKSKFKPDFVPDDVKNEELQIKIQENERLQRELYETAQTHKIETMTLMERLDLLESESKTHHSTLDEATAKHKMVIDKLQEDRAMLEVKLQKTEEELRYASMKGEKSQQQLKIMYRELTSRYENVSKVVSEKIMFNDTSHRKLNVLNVPVHDRKQQVKAREAVSQAAKLLKEFTKELSNFHTYTEKRLKALFVESPQEQISPSTEKFCSYLRENTVVLRSVDEAFNSFYNSVKSDCLVSLETLTGLQEFSDAFHDYVNFFKKLLPYHRLSIEEECNMSTCSRSLEGLSNRFLQALKRISTVFSKVDSYIEVLASASSAAGGLLPSNYNVCFVHLNTSLDDLHKSLQEVKKCYHSKATLEHQLPTVTETLKSTDERLVLSLDSLVAVTGKIVKFMGNNLDFFSFKSSFMTRGASSAGSGELATSPAVVEFRHQAAGYLQTVSRTQSASVPYQVALRDHMTLSTEDRQTLVQQMSVTKTRISKLEQEKDQWMLEAQLVEMKFKSRCEALEKELNELKSSTVFTEHQVKAEAACATPRSSTSSVASVLEVQETSLDLGDVSVVDDSKLSDDSLREPVIKSHFNNKIKVLNEQLQDADSKAASFSTECCSLYKRMWQAKQTYLADLKASESKISQLEDEVETTKRSYEEQLSMMSDHLCGINEKLMSQQDEINALKSGVSKTGKRGKK